MRARNVGCCLGYCLLCVLTTRLPGQAGPASAATPAKSANRYETEPGVIERREIVYRMAEDGTGSMQATVAFRVQSESVLKGAGVVILPFAGNTQRVEFNYVRVRRPDGTVVQTPTGEVMEIASPVTQQAPFYSDLKTMQLPVRNLKIGDTLEWQATILLVKAEAPGQFWGQENFVTEGVVLSQTLELHVPKDLAVKVWSREKKPVETVIGAERVYRWETAHLEATTGTEAEARKEVEKKRVRTLDEELDAKEGKLPDVAWTTFADWAAVGAWYRALEVERVQPDAEVKAKVAELTSSKTSEEERVRAVYGYVSGQIRYIGVAFGIGRLQPHAASVVLENQYGDCKDKHTLLAAMLSTLGLHPEAVLIGAGVRFNQAVPSPGSFNHLITRVVVEGKPVWLDATAEVAPYRMLIQQIRGEPALVIPGTGPARVERTPPDPPFASFQSMDANGALDAEGVSNSKIVLTLRGDDELMVRAVLRQTSPAQYDQLAQQISQNMGYAGTVTHAEFPSQENTSTPLKISYGYKREQGGDWPSRRALPQVAPVGLIRPNLKEPPVQAIHLGVKKVETSTSAMKLPEGWDVELPEAVHQRSAFATYDQTYRFENKTLFVTRRVEVLREEVPVAEWKDYSRWAEAIDLGNETYVQLTHTHAGSDKGTEGGTTSAKASDLVNEALETMRSNDLPAARSLLDRAKLIDPSTAMLWGAYGNLELRSGEMTAAAEDYRKEISLHPGDYRAYEALANTQLMLKERKAAKETLAQWAKANKADPTPVTRQMILLQQDGDFVGAIKAGEAEVAQLPEDKKKDEGLQFQLGSAQIAAGSPEKGSQTLVALLQSTENPGTLNDAAYALAEAKLDLPLAETSARKALLKMEEESETWTMDEDPQMLDGRTRTIEATWDTLGWIFFREGKLDQAEDFVRASWRGRQTAEVGRHLGEIELARGNRKSALTAFELADGTIFGYNDLGEKVDAGPLRKRLRLSMEELKRSGVRSPVTNVKTDLQKLRVQSLGEAKGLDGDAEYRMLLAGGTVTRVEAMGSKVIAGGKDRVLTTRFPALWPTGSKAHLVRTAFLNCHAGACELVFLP